MVEPASLYLSSELDKVSPQLHLDRKKSQKMDMISVRVFIIMLQSQI